MTTSSGYNLVFCLDLHTHRTLRSSDSKSSASLSQISLSLPHHNVPYTDHNATLEMADDDFLLTVQIKNE